MLPNQAGESVVILLAGPMDRVHQWYATLMADKRFSVQSFATDADDLGRKLAGSPEIVLLDAAIFVGPAPLVEMLTRVSGTAYVLLPFQADASTREALAALPSVKGVYVGDTPILPLTGKMHADAMARRQMAPSADWGARRSAPTGVTGLRIVAVWNQCGGAGRTTIATNLAYESARRGLRTLLVGLGAPDVLPLVLGLQASPNLTLWRANPSPEAFKNSLQRIGELDVLAGFPDVLAEGQALGASPEAPDSINHLVVTAAYGGYAVIVLDTPHSPLAAMALSAANTLLLVARPTLADAWCSVEAFRTLAERMAGQHRIAPENVYVVLSRARQQGLSASEWHAQASSVLKHSFPAVIATFAETVEVEAAQNSGKLPLLTSDAFARSLHTLADALLGTLRSSVNGARRAAEPGNGKVFKVGPLKIRTGK